MAKVFTDAISRLMARYMEICISGAAYKIYKIMYGEDKNDDKKNEVNEDKNKTNNNVNVKIEVKVEVGKPEEEKDEKKDVNDVKEGNKVDVKGVKVQVSQVSQGPARQECCFIATSEFSKNKNKICNFSSMSKLMFLSTYFYDCKIADETMVQ